MSESKGYGKWIGSQEPRSDLWYVRECHARTVDGARELATELLAWADAHDTVTLVVPKQTAEWYADPHKVWWEKPTDEHYPTVHNGRIVGEAARKALGMEP